MIRLLQELDRMRRHPIVPVGARTPVGQVHETRGMRRGSVPQAHPAHPPGRARPERGRGRRPGRSLGLDRPRHGGQRQPGQLHPERGQRGRLQVRPGRRDHVRRRGVQLRQHPGWGQPRRDLRPQQHRRLQRLHRRDQLVRAHRQWRGVAKLNPATGAVDTAFNANLASGKVTELALVGGRLLAGGTFPGKLRALNPATGANTGYLNLGITGSVASNAGPTEVYRFAVNPAATRLVAVGNFTSVGGQTRYRAFMLTLGATASVNPWYYPPLQNLCRAGSLPDYMRDVDFSPDGSWFAFVSTGYIPQSGGVGRDLCDATARFETATTSPARPTWINYTGGDTLHSVAATDVAVYVQGHQRWLDNPQGADSAARARSAALASAPSTRPPAWPCP